MPTKKPRVMVTLKPETYEALRRFAFVSHKPMGQFVAEILDQSRSMIDALSDAAEAQQQQQGEALEAALAPLRAGADRMTRDMHREVEGLSSQMRTQTRRGRPPKKKAA